jgi:hypothetical protein
MAAIPHSQIPPIKTAMQNQAMILYERLTAASWVSMVNGFLNFAMYLPSPQNSP